MKNIIILNKKEGETPLEALENFRSKNKKYKDVKMTYAGRLDPMASGVLLILTGEETKNKEKYLNLDKEYEFEILFGFSTDTYDILGKVISKQNFIKTNLRYSVDVKGLKKPARNVLNIANAGEEIKKNLKSFIGENMQEYPIYSSKTVNGKPLFFYARSGEEVSIPNRKVIIKKLKLKNIKKAGSGEYIRIINNKNLFKNIEKRINKVNGDFRQREILKIWKKELQKNNTFYIASFKIKCSSGTYIRVIANSLGNKLNMPALAYSIKRTKLGKYL